MVVEIYIFKSDKNYNDFFYSYYYTENFNLIWWFTYGNYQSLDKDKWVCYYITENKFFLLKLDFTF